MPARSDPSVTRTENLTSDEAMARCAELEADLAELRAAYDQYFLGNERLPPTKKHDAFKKTLAKLKTQMVRQTAVRFRLETLSQKLLTYERLWERTVREIEAGTYKRDLAKLRRKEGRRTERTKDSPSTDFDVDEDLDLSDLDEADGDDLASAIKAAEAAVTQPPAARPLAPAVAPLVPAVPSIAAVTPAQGTVRPTGTQPALTPSQGVTRSTGAQPVVTPSQGVTRSTGAQPVVTPSQGVTRPTGTQPVVTPSQGVTRPTGAQPALTPSQGVTRQTGTQPASQPRVTASQPTITATQPTSTASQPRVSASQPAHAPRPTADGGLSDAKLKAIYDAYVMAKKRCGEDTRTVTYDSVATTLKKQVPELMKQHNAKSVEFKVVIKDGKAVLRALPKE